MNDKELKKQISAIIEKAKSYRIVVDIDSEWEVITASNKLSKIYKNY